MAHGNKEAPAKKRPGKEYRAWKNMPERIRVLFISGRDRTGGWLADAFASDNAVSVELEEQRDITTGLARLRDEIFDVLLLSHDGTELNALDLLEGLRAAHADLPIVVLGTQSEAEMTAHFFDADADAYLCVNTTTIRTLIWTLSRAVERHQLSADNRRFRRAEARRQEQEQRDVKEILGQQRAMADFLHEQAEGTEVPEWRPGFDLDTGVHRSLEFPEELARHYQELLRTYVIMGSGDLSQETYCFARHLAEYRLSMRQALALHQHAVEELRRGLGKRSARHVVTRASLLLVELMAHVAEYYREGCLSRSRRWEQRALPGFENLTPGSKAA